MRLTIENIPEDLERAIRSRAEAEGKTLDEFALEALRTAAASAKGVKKRDFASVAGTWVDEPAFEQVRQTHEQIDPDIWR